MPQTNNQQPPHTSGRPLKAQAQGQRASFFSIGPNSLKGNSCKFLARTRASSQPISSESCALVVKQWWTCWMQNIILTKSLWKCIANHFIGDKTHQEKYLHPKTTYYLVHLSEPYLKVSKTFSQGIWCSHNLHSTLITPSKCIGKVHK